MTLQQLKYAIAIADTRNITEASKRVFISQPSLTAAIHELEEEMGVTIFNRSNKGVTITNEGDEFLSYARQVLEQASLMEDRYKGGKGGNTIFSVSCQHYSFAVNAFVDVIRKFGGPSYDFTLRETQTNEIIDDIAKLKSEIGVLYLSYKNEKVIKKLIQKNNLVFEPLFATPLHVFMSSKNPLAKKEKITLEDLKPYPYLTYEQGDFNSFYFAEEPLTAIDLNLMVSENSPLLAGPLDAHIRLGHKGSPAKILDLEPGRIRVEFETPQFAAAPGQVLVLYSGEGVVASAIIDK